MNEPVYLAAINDLENNLHLAMEFSASMDFREFESDYRTQYAVIRALEICGEATKRIPEDVRALEPGIPFKAMAGMRDRLIHGYDNVNAGLIWSTVTVTIPATHTTVFIIAVLYRKEAYQRARRRLS